MSRKIKQDLAGASLLGDGTRGYSSEIASGKVKIQTAEKTRSIACGPRGIGVRAIRSLPPSASTSAWSVQRNPRQRRVGGSSSHTWPTHGRLELLVDCDLPQAEPGRWRCRRLLLARLVGELGAQRVDDEPAGWRRGRPRRRWEDPPLLRLVI